MLKERGTDRMWRPVILPPGGGIVDDIVMVEIPVSREVASALDDEGRRAAVGRLVSNLLRPSASKGDPLRRLIAEIKSDARADGLTDAEIEAELAAYNAENRV
jgi:hypothetical protein